MIKTGRRESGRRFFFRGVRRPRALLDARRLMSNFNPNPRRLCARVYDHHAGVPGVLFLSMEINSTLARWGARQFFFLPYYDAEMNLAQKSQTTVYHSERTSADAPAPSFDATWPFGEPLPRTEPD